MKEYKIGRNIILSLSGESHSEYLEGKIKGLKAGIHINQHNIDLALKRRQGGQNYTTKRKEPDKPIFLSGIDKNGKTTGEEIVYRIYNKQMKKSDYGFQQTYLRPSHSDLGEYFKTGKAPTYTGGGRFSGRLTALMVVAGAIAKDVLQSQGIRVYSRIKSLGTVNDKDLDYTNIKEQDFIDMQSREDIPMLCKGSLNKAKELLKSLDGDSVGACSEVIVLGMKPGYGDALSDGVEGMISTAIFSVPGVKAIAFGNGFESTKMFGSQNNDEIYFDKNKEIRTKTNNFGGVLGGITTNMPIYFSVAFKPTSSIFKEQKTVNLKTMKNETFKIKGRHDPCIAIRGTVVLEMLTAFVMLDLLYGGK